MCAYMHLQKSGETGSLSVIVKKKTQYSYARRLQDDASAAFIFCNMGAALWLEATKWLSGTKAQGIIPRRQHEHRGGQVTAARIIFGFVPQQVLENSHHVLELQVDMEGSASPGFFSWRFKCLHRDPAAVGSAHVPTSEPYINEL